MLTMIIPRMVSRRQAAAEQAQETAEQAQETAEQAQTVQVHNKDLTLRVIMMIRSPEFKIQLKAVVSLLISMIQP